MNGIYARLAILFQKRYQLACTPNPRTHRPSFDFDERVTYWKLICLERRVVLIDLEAVRPFKEIVNTMTRPGTTGATDRQLPFGKTVARK